MTELEKELTIKVKRLEDDCKAYNFTQHELQEKNKELEAQIEKMKCCENCKHAWCRTSSSSKDKEGKQIFHKWNNTKRKYCDVGKNGKYQCWELAD